MEPRRRFRFLKELSEGAFGKVYLAEMITGDNFKSAVAIKLLHGKWATHKEIVQRSRDEARVLGLLHHRNIIRVDDLTSINGQCAIIMEYLDGVDLKTLVNSTKEGQTIIPRKVIFEIGSQIASALDAAYNKQPLQGGKPLALIHRDIKPSNVMVTVAGDVKVLDFGTAQARFDDREAHTQALAFGSAAYMAPERLLGDPDAPSGDVFSLGIALYELLALDTFGKIHIREERFENKLTRQLDKLDLTDLDDERAQQVRMTMRLLLAYDADGRPTAAQVTELLEALADEMHDGSVRRFCREVVRPIRDQLNPDQDPNDPLTGSTVFEDTANLLDVSADDEAAPPETPELAPDPSGIADPSDLDVPATASPPRPPPPPSLVTASPSMPQTPPDPAHGMFGAPMPGSGDALPDLFSAPTVNLQSARAAGYMSGGGLPPDPSGVADPGSASGARPRVVASTGPALGPGQLREAAKRAASRQSAPEPAPAPAPPPPAPAPAPAPARPPVAASGRPPVAAAGRTSSSPPARATSSVRSAARADAPPPTRSGGGAGKLIVVAVLAMVTLGAVGGAVAFSGILDGVFDTEAPPPPKTDGGSDDNDTVSGRDGGVVEVAEMTDKRGVVVLTVTPPSSATVRIDSVASDFKEEWNSSGKLELRGLDEGRYRTKVAPKDGSAQRGTFVAKPGMLCSYTCKASACEWTEVSCEAVQ